VTTSGSSYSRTRTLPWKPAVTENGTISYPLVGTVKVGGLTIPAAEQAIAKASKRRRLYPEAAGEHLAAAKSWQSGFVPRLGGRPGRYPLETFNTKISEMMAIAGGIQTAVSSSPAAPIS
jgi:polysaccharide export outer membrane protein